MDDDDVAREDDRREVRGAEQQLGAAGAQRQDALLPRVPGAVGERRRRARDRVALRPQRRQARAQLARPPLDPAELGPDGRAAVDQDGHASPDSMSPRWAMFAVSSGAVLGGGREPRVEDLAELRLGGRAQAEREHVRVVPLACTGGGRGVAAQRRADARDLVRGDRRARARSSSTRRPARRGPRRRRGPRPRRTRPSRRGRRRPARRAARGSWPRRRSSATTASATPVRSSAATAIRIDPSIRFGRYRRGVVDAPSEPAVLAIGRDLAAALPAGARSPMRLIDDRAMDLASQDAELRAALFRFVDVVPACRDLDDLARHLTGFLDEVDDRPPSLQVAMRMGSSRAGRQALGAASAAGVKHMAHRFIVGATPRDATGVLEGLWKDGVGTSVDLLGEATVTAAEADRYAARCHEALDGLHEVYRRLPARPRLEADSFGAIPRENLSVKVSALTPLLRPDAPERGKRDAAPRLRDLLRHAREVGAHLHIDMESFDSREAVTDLVLELLSEDEFRDGPSAGLVLQAYLRDSPDLCERVVAWASSAGRAQPLVVRLVKGAYWDHEVVEARQHGWESPVFEVKAESDRNFEALTRRLIERARRDPARDRVAQPALGRPRGRRQPLDRRRPTATSSSRSCAASATTSSTRSPPAACACARTARSATSWPGWPISCAGCSRTRPTSRSSPSRRAARPIEELLAAP